MLVTQAFQVYKNIKYGLFQYIDGRLLCDIKINDTLMLINYPDTRYDIKNIDNANIIYIADNMSRTDVIIKEILSYGVLWEYLNGGMSARIGCECNMKISEKAILYRVIG